MEDLISFEDLVVLPCNSYFNLEKELHEVKIKLSLMERRFKYLEEKIGYGCKGQLTLEEKIESLNIKYEELDDTIVIVEDSLQKDIKSIQEDRGKDNVKIHNDIKCLKDRVDCLEYNDSATEDVEEIQCMSSKNIDTPSLPSITINSTGITIGDKLYYCGLTEKMVDIILKIKNIDKLIINFWDSNINCYDVLKILKDIKVLRLFIYNASLKQTMLNLLMIHNIKLSYLQIEKKNIPVHEIENIQRYCDNNKIELKVY
jgi:hypothetical protein